MRSIGTHFGRGLAQKPRGHGRSGSWMTVAEISEVTGKKQYRLSERIFEKPKNDELLFSRFDKQVEPMQPLLHPRLKSHVNRRVLHADERLDVTSRGSVPQ